MIQQSKPSIRKFMKKYFFKIK